MATVYDMITERILAQLNQGTAPWHKPWKSVNGEEPMNLTSRKAYRGLNRFLLSVANYERPYFVTYKQALELGGHVKQGEKGSPVIFWKRNTYTKAQPDGTETEEQGFLLRYYTVFNVSQCEGLGKWLPALPTEDLRTIEPIEAAERIARGYPNAPAIHHVNGNLACYRPKSDEITLPLRNQFVSGPAYYSTLFHEMTHATGHAVRLNRSTLTDLCPFGSTNYSKEELVAEMGAAFLCGEAGIDNEAALKNSAAYIDGWRKKLSRDSKVVVHAAAQAQKAADYILRKEIHS